MRTRSVTCLVFASVVTICGTHSWTLADHFRSIPLDESAGHMHYRIVDEAGTTILIVRAKSEYGSVELRARDITERLDQALDNLLTHEDLYLEAEWRHGRPGIHQVSRDGTVHFMIVAVTPGDVIGAKRRGGPGEAVELAREWLDRIDDATKSARLLESQAGVGEPGPSDHSAKADAPHESGSRGAEESGAVSHSRSPRVRSGILLRLEPADSAAYLDDTLISFEDPGPIPASPGEHVIEVVRPGYRPYSEKIEVQEGKILSLDVRLEPEDNEQN